MVNALSPVRGLKDGFTRIYDPHLKDQDRAPNINRVWTAVFGLLALGLGIAFMVSCSSDMTSSTHLVSVNTTQLILDITNNNTLVNNTSNAARSDLLNIFQQSQARLPDQYLFGLSGCCRIYTNGSRYCAKAFPQSPDILTIVITDINAVAAHASGNNSINPVGLVGPNFSSMQQSYISISKAYTAVVTTCVVWTLISVIFVMVFAHQSKLHLVTTIPGVIMAVGSAAVFTWCILIQLGTYELSENYAAISFGPGSFLLWAWMACVMLLTPLTAIISIIAVFTIILIILWIAFLCVVVVLACLACVGGGDQQTDDRWYNNPWYNNPNNPNSPFYSPPSG